MKFLYLVLWILFVVMLLILYFQNIIVSNVPLKFFTSRSIDVRIFLLVVYFFGILAGVFLTLAITSFMKWDNNLDDWFEL